MDEESKKLSIEFLEKWTTVLRYNSKATIEFMTEEDMKEFIGGLNFVLVALRGNMPILHDRTYPK